MMQLEPRIMFDGAAATTAEAVVIDHAAHHADTQLGVAMEKSHAVTPPPAPDNAVPANTNAVVFIDARIVDAPSLLRDVAKGTQIVYLQNGQDGLQQIANYLDQHQGVSSVQIIAHGNAGDLWLGNSYLSADNVQARSAVLAEIGKDMKIGGDILIYACNTAASDVGINFVNSLAQLTGRDIAASNNRTGVGGDWDLEIATGTIESHNVLSAQSMAAYRYGLATVTVTNNGDSGVGSLRQALSDAVVGDTVTFNTTMTVNLNSQLTITKNVTVEGDLNHDGIADVTLNGQYKTRVLQISSGITATLDGLIITNGLMAGDGGNGGNGTTAANLLGAGISNLGNLTLNNVIVTANAASGGGGGGGVTGGDVGGGGGGGGAVGGGNGGHGGITGSGSGVYAGTAGTANQGGTGGGYRTMGGHGGSSSGGAGSTGIYGYTNGSAGGTAASGALSIGGGGGGSGWNSAGGKGGGAAGGIYNASGATLTIVGTSSITGNIGAGGGGGGGSASGSGTALNGGDGGLGVGAIWNKGTVLITASNFAALSGASNTGASGNGGLATAASAGNKPTAVNGLFNDIGGTANTAYNPTPTATIVVTNTAQHIGSTSLVTITFSQAVTGFTNADLTIANGTLSAVSSSDGGVTWTATLTPANAITDTTNLITLDNTGVQSVSLGTAGVGTSTSNNYAIDTVRPTATIVFTDTALKIGDTSLVTFTFSEAVSGFTNADLTIANGTLTAVSSSDGGITWIGTFTPTASITDTTNLVTLDNTGIADLAGNAGSGTTDSNNYAIDTVRPTATIVVADTALRMGETSLVTVTFSEAVSGFTNADLTIANGTLTAVSSSDGGITWTATFTPSASVNDTTNLITLNNTGVSDLSGNAGSGTTDSNNYAIDTVRPTATIVVADNALKIGETSLVTITFAEAVTGFTNADLTIANGTLTSVSSGDGGITWTATFTPTASITDTTNLVTLDNTGVSDLAGNAGSGTTDSNNYAIDTVRPTATIVVADNALKIGETSLVTVTFSEAVSGFTNADLTIANGTLTSVSSGDGGITWTATFTPSASTNDATNLITLDNTGVADLSGNAGTGSTDSNNYAIDTQRPTATIVLADPTLTAGETSLATITFSEVVTGFTNADLTIANGTLSSVSSSDGGVTWTATFTPTVGVNDSSNVITLANTGVADVAGNTGSGTTNSGNYTIDTVLPTATIVVADNALKIGETSLATITFSEAVTGFTNADLTIANGTLTAVSSSDGGITWTATFTPSASTTDATNLITLDNSGVQNASGNAGSGTTDSNNYAIDTIRPTATILVADNALSIGETSLVTFTFSEAVTGFTNADLTIANGTLTAVSSNDGGITWTATFTPTASTTDATNLITLDNTGIADLSGNAGTGSTDSNNYGLDSQRPTATIVLSDTTLSPGETALVTVTFSEAVTGFDNSDLSISNGTLTAVSSSDGGITWTATFTPTASTTDATNVITLSNSGISDLAGNIGTGTTNSGNYAVETEVPTATILVADNALKAGETSLVTITFSSAVSGFTNADLTIANGTLSTVSSGDGGITWTATFTPTGSVTDATNLISLDNTGVTNASGNSGIGITDSNNYAIDTARPTATIAFADTTLATGETSLVTFIFSEAVTGFTNADLTIANGSMSAVSSSDGGITWTATFTPAASTADTTNLISIDNTGVQDAAGNTGTGTTDSANYIVDTQNPAVISVSVPTDATYMTGQNLDFTVNLSEAVLVDTSGGTPRIAVSLDTGGVAYANYLSGSGTSALVFRLSVTPGQLDSSGISLAGSLDLNGASVRDAAGNDTATGLHSVGSTADVLVDAVAPSVTSVDVPAAGDYKAGEVLSFTVQTSEAVVVNAAGGAPRLPIDLDGTAVYATYVSGSGSTSLVFQYTIQTGHTDANGISVASNLEPNGATLHDAAGNTMALALNGVGSTSGVLVDTTPPTILSISPQDSSPTSGDTVHYTITLSEAVQGLDAGDFQLTKDGTVTGTISALTQVDSQTYVVTISDISGTGALQLSLAGAGSHISDAAGNALQGSLSGAAYAIAPPESTAPPAPIAPPVAIQVLPPPSQPTPTIGSDPIQLGPVTPNIVLAVFSNGMGTTALPSLTMDHIGNSQAGNGLQLSSPPGQSIGFALNLPTVGADPSDGRTTSVPARDTPFITMADPSQREPIMSLPDLGTHSVQSGQNFGFALPPDSFSQRDPDARLSITVRQVNGSALPAWIRFDPATGWFSGKAPPGQSQTLVLEIVVRDASGAQATSRMEISFEKSDAPAAPGSSTSLLMPQGKPGLHEQFAQFGHTAFERDCDALLDLLATA